MLVNFLRKLLRIKNGVITYLRLMKPRILGLRTGCNVCAGSGIVWPLGNVRNIQIGDTVSLGRRGWFYLPLDNRQAKIQIGPGTAVGDDFVITANASIQIGRDCLLSYRVTVMDHSHVTGPGIAPVTSGLTEGKPIRIGDKCFLGCNVVIMPGVQLGENCVVGANSVVTKSFASGSVIAGAPAKLLRTLPLKP